MLIVLLGAAALVVLYGIALYNGLVARQTQVETEWSQIDVQLKRRSDLVPNLVEIVKDYMGYEQETLIAVVEAIFAIQAELEENYEPTALAEIIYEFYTRLARAAIDSEHESVDFFKLAERDIATLKPLVKALDDSGTRKKRKEKPPSST